MYGPPKDKWYIIVGERAYNEGWMAAATGKNISDCPYEYSNHERDTTFEDYALMWWEKGFEDALEGENDNA